MVAKKAAARTRKKIIEPEIMPDTDEQDELEQAEDEPMVTQRNIFDRKIPLSQALGMTEGDEEEYIEEQRAEKKKKSLRQKIKERLQKGRSGAGEQLVMRVDRMTSFESDGELGVMADKVICFRMPVTLEYMEREDYIPEIMRRVPKGGDFTITTRDRVGVLDIIDIHIDKQQPPAQPVTVTDPATGQSTIIYQSAPSTPSQPVGVADPMRQFRDSLKMVKEMREAFGNDVAATAPTPAAPFDASAFAAQLLQTKEVMGAIISGIAGVNKTEKRRDIVELAFDKGPDIITAIFEGARSLATEIMSIKEQREMREGNRNAQAERTNGEEQVSQPPRRIQPRAGSGPVPQPPGAENPDAGAQTAERGTEQQGASQETDPRIKLSQILMEGYAQKAEPKDVAAEVAYLIDCNSENDPLLSMYEAIRDTPAKIILKQAKAEYGTALEEELRKALDSKEMADWLTEVQNELKRMDEE